MNPLAKLLALVRPIALNQGSRRGAIFTLTMVTLVMLFLGSTAFDGYLSTHVGAFVVYWLLCAWLTLTFMVLALYDMLALVLAGRRARREGEGNLSPKQNPSTKPSSSTTSPDP